MIKKIILILVMFLVPLLIYMNVGIVRNLIAKALLPSSFGRYKFLSSNKVESENYRITKIIDGEIDGELLFNTLTQEFLVRVRDSDYDRNNQNWHAIWKVNKEGAVIDSINTTSTMNNQGTYFERDYYIDWVNAGNKAKQKYKQFIDFDSISIAERDNYFEQALEIAYDTDYLEEKLRCFLKIENDWIVLESKVGFEKDYGTNIKETFKYETKYNGLLIVLENAIVPFHKWGDMNSFIYVQKFVEKSREFRSFYDINNTSRSGWHGMAYIQLIHNSEFFHFKAHTFKNTDFGTGSYTPSISFYEAPKRYGIYLSNIAFVGLGNSRRTKRFAGEVGLYVIHKKNKN